MSFNWSFKEVAHIQHCLSVEWTQGGRKPTRKGRRSEPLQKTMKTHPRLRTVSDSKSPCVHVCCGCSSSFAHIAQSVCVCGGVAMWPRAFCGHHPQRVKTGYQRFCNFLGVHLSGSSNAHPIQPPTTGTGIGIFHPCLKFTLLSSLACCVVPVSSNANGHICSMLANMQYFTNISTQHEQIYLEHYALNLTL